MQNYGQQVHSFTPYGGGGGSAQGHHPYSEAPSLTTTPSLLSAAQGGAGGVYLPSALAAAGFGGAVGGIVSGHSEEGKIYALVIDLMDASTREAALLELSKKREQYDELALVLWHSFGV